MNDWQDPSTDIENVNAAYRIEYELANCYRDALQRILDHGQTHKEPCWAIHNGDCADVFQEIARGALAFDPLSRERSS